MARDDRRHAVGRRDQRTPFQNDRDRIAYSSAFHRLSGVTQVVRAGEADTFHTRQQHSYKVAQVGRRLAEKFLDECGNDLQKELHPEVVEAACLAHDLGHPPFGHAGERVLHKKVSEEHDDPDGFEGNAQTFRIITKLAVRYDRTECDGLNLTQATLNACLKYPWKRNARTKKKANKWCVYSSEIDDFNFARTDHKRGDESQSLEASIMDWADDISYSVHDLEDFHRCGVLPWQRILGDDATSERILERAGAAWFGAPKNSEQLLQDAFLQLKKSVFEIHRDLLESPYQGTRSQRHQLRNLTSTLVGKFIGASSVHRSGRKQYELKVEEQSSVQVRLLKQITRDYIIQNPSLAAQQIGQKRIIETLFDLVFEAYRPGRTPEFLPIRLRYLDELSGDSKARFACDCVCALTEREATELYQRLSGASAGSVLDPIVR